MTIRIVQSRQNARVKELRATLLHPGRGNGDLVALEGMHLLVEALNTEALNTEASNSGFHIATVFVAQGHEHLLQQLNLPASVEILALPPEVLASAVTTENPQPIAALARSRTWDWPSILTAQPLIVILAGLQDPGNLGAILRSAEAFGATGVISLPGTVSRWNPKAMRASAGSVFRLPVLAASEDECFNRLRNAGIQTLATMAHDAQLLGNHDLAAPVALVIGAEGSGLAPERAARCDACITIPCPGPVESLNAAVAASILLYEAARQRGTAPGTARGAARGTAQ
jgi:RNA methyltransferase, TrmH family